ncbi:WGR domain-containing protein, partial [Pontimicrobium sp. MEBiC01747]
MKILHQKTLYFSEGKSDKVYEVDLCESGSDLYIVNFRYGRRGANLREGTKTVFPVPYDEALKVFNSLVSSKEKKGYSETLSERSEKTPTPSQATEINTAREQTILKYLKEAVADVYTRNWKVSRIVWRAADLNITKAIPSIVHFINSEDAFEQYASIHALSKFKDVSGRDAIYNVFNTLGFKDKVGRIAAAYILKLGKADYKNTVIQSATNNL